METALFLLAILSVFLTIWSGSLLLTCVGAFLTGRHNTVRIGQYLFFAVPVTYLIYFFLMRGGN